MVKASYPFEEKFRAAVDALDTWHCIVVSQVDWLPEELIAMGYTLEQVQSFQDILKAKSFEELFELALQDGDNNSPAKLVLQNREDRETFDKTSSMCLELDPNKRANGLLILMRKPGETYSKEARRLLRKLAKAENQSVAMEALAYAMAHLNIEERSKYLQEAAIDERGETRFAVAFSLGGCGDRLASQMLIKLSSDEDDEVRDWATFGLHLGGGTYSRTKEVREALFARLHDKHIDTQLEAVQGLAKLKDERVLEVLIDFLKEEHPYMSMIEAAEHMAHPSLLPYLLELSEDDDVKRAIAACSKNQSN